jgi:hypothetical protein
MLIITHNTYAEKLLRLFQYCLGNFLHPKYKGSMLNVGGDNTTFETTKGNLVNNHQSHIDYLASQELFQLHKPLPTYTTHSMSQNSICWTR